MASRAAPTDLAGLARFILSDECREIAILTGHGVTESTGFPEYKTKPPSDFLPHPNQLERLSVADDAQLAQLMKNPSAVLTWDLFRDNSLPYLEVLRPFILGTQEQKWKATVCHKFAEMLHCKTGKLRRVYTHNIDGLEYQFVGGGRLPAQKILAVNGSLAMVACEGCGTPANYQRFCEAVRMQIKDLSCGNNNDGAPDQSTPIFCYNCNKPLVKPTVKLLRRRSTPESLHQEFFAQMREDLPHLDLLLILGQKMWALPTSQLIADAEERTVRVIVQQNPGGGGGMSTRHLGLDFEHPGKSRDAFIQGACEVIIKDLVRELGWTDSQRTRPDPPAPIAWRRPGGALPSVHDKAAVSQQQLPFASQKQPPRGTAGNYRDPSCNDSATNQHPHQPQETESGPREQAELPDCKDQCRSVEVRPTVTQVQHKAPVAFRETRVEGSIHVEGTATYPDFKDQCRSVEPSRPPVAGASGSSGGTSSSTIPFAKVVSSLNANDEGEDDFVFRPSCLAVDTLKDARTHDDIVKAIRDIGLAVDKTKNPNYSQESHTIVAAGGLVAIRERMKELPKDVEVQESSCSALWYLAASDDSAVTATCLSAVLRAMQAIPKNATVQHNACGVLRSLAANKDICPKIVRAGGVVAILIAMRNHPDASKVQKVACSALASLAKADAALICQQGGVVDIVAAMKTHSDVELVQEQGCGAIWQLAINHEEGLGRIRRDGAIPAVRAAMTRHGSKNATIETYGQWTLEALERTMSTW